MPAIDLNQLVRSAIQKNQSIPAVIDSYSEFLDSPIGPLELQDLDSVFSAILGNISERFPQVASTKAITTARNDITLFLSSAGGDPARVKDVLRRELKLANHLMTASIGERLSRATSEEKRALDATLRLVRRSREDILLRAEPGKGIESSGAEFTRFFAAVKAESPGIRELRFQNLIVEKAIFNKLVLKSKSQNFPIWVPSYFAKENSSALIERLGVPSEHLLLSNLREIRASGGFKSIEPLLSELSESNGVLSASSLEEIPEQIRDYFVKIENTQFIAITPLELDDVSLFLSEIADEERALRAREAEEVRKKAEEERVLADQAREQKLMQRRASVVSRSEQMSGTVSPHASEIRQVARDDHEAIYIGKEVDLQQLVSYLNKRLPESEIRSQVRTLGDYYVDHSTVRENGIAIVGASGSGRSMTLRRILDGVASSQAMKVIVVDQKGEHRGIAWKHKWQVFAFAQDSQAQQLRVALFSEDPDDSEFFADIVQEWCLSSGVNCSDQQRARIASIVRSEKEKQSLSPETIPSALAKEADLVQISAKIGKNFLSKNLLSRLFSSDGSLSWKEKMKESQSTLFDISGRGLRDPTTKEERLIVTVSILRELSSSDLTGCVLVLEDFLDRFKSENLRRKVLELVTKLRAGGNSIVATSRSEIRGFVGPDCLELLHRLSGEKIVNEELAGFKMGQDIRGFQNLISFLPRGYAFASSIQKGNSRISSAAVRIEPLQFT